ncbi:4884_t:CDS:2 [Racocetra persica]|uniref:4884_t:CDS:1 n=1 Tax=Racocetra persica TaxID=160502 RepID=A0ACA9Q6P2_9GLOM|nr:4884_t:CDS:2 [Racocetra persica]
MYVDRESKLKNVDKILGRYLDDSNFAGTYIDVKTNSVIIYTVNMAKKHNIISKPDVREHERLLVFRRVRNPLARLKSKFNELDTIAKLKKPKGIFVYIHPRFNNIAVVVFWPPDQSSQEFIGAARRLGADIYFPFNDNTPLTKRGLGKRKARPFKNKKFFTKYGLIGHLVYHSETPYDIGLIDIESMRKLRPSTNIRNDQNATYPELTIIEGPPVSSHGAHLCRSGATSLASCGYVDAFNGIFLDETGIYESNIIIIDKMSSVGGDSGGPAYYFSDFSNLRLVTITGISTASLKRQDIPLYPFGVVFPKEIILDRFQLDLITRF